MTRRLTLSNFIALRQVCQISAFKNLIPYEDKMHQSSQNHPLRTNARLRAKFHCALPNHVPEKCHNFLPTCEFRRPRGTLGPKFTNFGNAEQQGQIYQCAKFRPVLTTCVRQCLLPKFVETVNNTSAHTVHCRDSESQIPLC